MIPNTVKPGFKFKKRVYNFSCDVYWFIKPQNYFKIQKDFKSTRGSTKCFFPERTFHPLIIMLQAETEVKKKRKNSRIVAVLSDNSSMNSFQK